MRLSLLNLALAAAISATLTACAGKQDIGPNGYSVSYTEGYSDGCHSSQRGRLLNDDDRFDSEEQYAMGWSDGYRNCESPEDAAKRQMRTSNLNKGINAEHEKYFQSYSLGNPPSTKVSPSSIRIF